MKVLWEPHPRLRLFAAWYDGWVGYFYDQPKRQLYLMIPFIGWRIQL